ncbi:hypothetical protein DVH24_011520 [Malus domestica]|uniref:Uncharacterized protein n=1 Tax=Malus domestica TaxID=3750 RepID=A0A498JVK2_MALDO|nr:hypothetical protein DVH24_011520 [Malus domestica]
MGEIRNTCQNHFVVKWNLLVGRHLVGGKNPTYDSGCSSKPKAWTTSLKSEAAYGKAPEEYGPRLNSRGCWSRSRRYNDRELNSVVKLLLWDRHRCHAVSFSVVSCCFKSRSDRFQ